MEIGKGLGYLVLVVLLQLMPTNVATANDYPLYEIPLTEREQGFICETANHYGLSYELCLAVMAVESSFDKTAQNGNSHGLMQLNENTYPTLAEQLKIGNFDVYGFQHNVQAGIFMLAQERDYWTAKGYSDEEVFHTMLLSYNRGRAGAKRYMSEQGMSAPYVDKVLTYKSDLEQGAYGGG